MTGSGGTLFTLFDEPSEADVAAQFVRRHVMLGALAVELRRESPTTVRFCATPGHRFHVWLVTFRPARAYNRARVRKFEAGESGWFVTL